MFNINLNRPSKLVKEALESLDKDLGTDRLENVLPALLLQGQTLNHSNLRPYF